MTRLTAVTLRQQHPRFFYHEAYFEVNEATKELVVHFTFSLENGPTFRPRLIYPNLDLSYVATLDQAFLQEFAFQIGLVEMLSYWKASVSPEIVIEAGHLSAAQLPFWQNLLLKGLSEFFFVNQIDAWQPGFVKWTVASSSEKNSLNPIDAAAALPLAEAAFIAVGGGKDSVVSLELAKKLPFPAKSLTLNQNQQVARVLAVTNEFSNQAILRQMDPQVFLLNEQGYLNGHTPFSALFAFISSLAGVLYNTKYVVVSNEWSANEGNTIFHGHTINHQYSKTFEFELAFRQYLHTYLVSDLEYFSWLRPLHEIQIAQLFAQFPKYFSSFLSCNRGQKTGKWCGECPKCLFVYIMLSAFLAPETVEQIWQKNLMADEKLSSILAELTGQTEVKSLECVGTSQETLLALSLALQKFPRQLTQPLWIEARQILKADSRFNNHLAEREFLTQYQNETLLPPIFRQALKQMLAEFATESQHD